MELEIEIKPMRDSHVAAVSRLEQETFSRAWAEDTIRQAIAQEKAVFFVAMHGKTVAGCAGMDCIAGEGYISKVVVSPQYRRRGIGRKLIRALETYAQANDMTLLTLEVRVSNVEATMLYGSRGFLVCGRRPKFYREPAEDALIMTKYLKGGEAYADTGH